MLKDVLAEIIRIEYEEKTGKMYLVFEVKTEKFKNFIKNNWTQDLEYKLIDKCLVEDK